MTFIPELRDRVVIGLRDQRVPESVIVESLRKWDAGEDANTPMEHGCFEVFRSVQRQVET